MKLLEKAKQVLTPREIEYFMIMNGKAGTLFIQGPPGGGKSATFKSIAEKLGMRYLPFDAPAMEETELGLYPKTLTYGDKEVVKYVPPLWAVDAERSSEPVLIVFEEINRNIRLMNAILNILNERRIGFEVKFGDNVFLAATGNLGEADGTVVEEMDNAQKGRLIIRKHTVSGAAGLEEWEAAFAGVATTSRPNGKVLPIIRDYLKQNPAHIRPDIEKNSPDIVVDSRRWTFLNEAIIENVGYNSTIEEIRNFVLQGNIGLSYIGNYALQFVEFLNQRQKYTVQDVLAGKAVKVDRDIAADLAEQLRAIDFLSITKQEATNMINWLKTMEHDQQVSFLCEYVCNEIQRFDTSVDEGVQAVNQFFSHPNGALLRDKFKKEISYLTE